MVFSDIHFLYLFLPAFLVAYYIIPGRFKNAALFAGSVLFYALGSPEHPIYTLLLIVSAVASWAFGRFIASATEPSYRKTALAIALTFLFGELFVCKYLGFLISSLNSLTGALGIKGRLPVVELTLPVGISFYVFQSASYLIDVYRGKFASERSLINYGAYLTMFPQLIAGPIVNYSTVKARLHKRKHTFVGFTEGLKTFILGLGLKVILANNLAGLWRDAHTVGYESISTPMAWLAVIAYSLQLYFDFYGYSLMAKGMGRMLGFKLPDNFLHPYLSTSMTEFWRRWHVTLGTWFREYIYIPLGGNRKGLKRTILNMLVVWLLTGLWHGASTNFLIWGGVLFVIMVLERLFLKNALDRFKPLGHLYMMILIPVTWAIFAETDLSRMGILLSRMFGINASAYAVLDPRDFLDALGSYWYLLIAGVLLSTELPLRLYTRIKDSLFGTLLLAAMLGLSVYLICIGLNDPFLYFRF